MKSGRLDATAKRVVRNIGHATRKQYAANEKIGIKPDGPKGKNSMAVPS